MSRGPGHVQRAIASAFAAHPHRQFTHRQLAEIAYPGEEISKKHTDAVNRALLKIAERLGLHCCQAGRAKHPGWRNVWGIG